MTIPTSSDLKEMDYVYKGSPFIYVAAKNSTDSSSMDYVYEGGPFVTNPNPSTETSSIKTINGLAYASVTAINGLAKASVKTWCGLA